MFAKLLSFIIKVVAFFSDKVTEHLHLTSGIR